MRNFRKPLTSLRLVPFSTLFPQGTIDASCFLNSLLSLCSSLARQVILSTSGELKEHHISLMFESNSCCLLAWHVQDTHLHQVIQKYNSFFPFTWTHGCHSLKETHVLKINSSGSLLAHIYLPYIQFLMEYFSHF